MIRPLISLTLLGLPATLQPALACPDANPDRADQLRFTEKAESDTLHGRFLGFSKENTLRWESPEAKDPIVFSTEKLHRILLNRGHGHKRIPESSTVTLINGDTLPGKITSLQAGKLQLQTSHLGELAIPIDVIASISPSPHGGKVSYYGPLGADEWKVIDGSKAPEKKEKADDKEPAKEDQKEKPKAAKEEENIEDKDKAQPINHWRYGAGAWYSGTDRNSILTLPDVLPDSTTLRFKAAWKGSFSLTAYIHADFKAPPSEKDRTSNTQFYHIGQAYQLYFSSSSVNLSEVTFDEDGIAKINRISGSYISTGLSRDSSAEFELKFNKKDRICILYVNGSFKAKWDLGDEYTGKGKGLAFTSVSYSSRRTRVSDILISEWNGRRDSAASMSAKDKDVVLLTNGLDRFSGKLLNITDGKARFLNKYGSEMDLPLNSIAELKLATSSRRKVEEGEDETICFTTLPYGCISGYPSTSEKTQTQITSPLLGKITLNTNYVSLIDFSRQNNLLDLWDDNF